MKHWNPVRVSTAALIVAGLLQAPAYAQSLKDAVDMVVKTSPDVLVETNQRLANDEAVKNARGGYFPKVDLLAGTGNEWSDNTTTRIAGYNDWRKLNRQEAQITLTQMLFDGFAVSSEVGRNKARVESAAWKVLGTSEAMGLRGVEAYLNVLRNQELVRLAKENLDAHVRTMDQINIRSTGGVGRKSDQEQSAARLGLARANLVSAEANLRDAEINFQRIVGARPIQLSKPVAPESSLIPKTPDEASQTAVSNHPILKSANADVKAAEYQREAAKSTLYPRFDLELGYGNNKNLDGVKGDNDEKWAMLRMRYNLFRGGSDMARISETTHLTNEAREVMSRTQRQVEESTRLSWNAYTSAAERLPAMKTHADMSMATSESYAKQFNLGQRTLLDLLDSVNESFTSQMNYTSAMYLEMFARYRVLADMGQLLNYLGVQPPVEAWLP